MQTSHVQPIDQDLLQKYVIYARQKVFPKWGDTDREKLSRFYAEMRRASFDQGGAPMTVRHVDGMLRIAEANARMELRQHVTSKDVDNAIAIMLESFIQSQKHNVAEELRTRFRSFISSSTPQADLFVTLLESLFQQRAERLRESRPDGDVPEISAVTIGMDDVLREVNRRDVDWEQMRNFILTDRFRERFRLDANERLCRVI
jgi:DNA replication licensing factor MCM2